MHFLVHADLPEGSEPDPFRRGEKHIGLYPGDEAAAVFKDRLEGLAVSKGTIRFPYGIELPEGLIMDIARWCREKYQK